VATTKRKHEAHAVRHQGSADAIASVLCNRFRHLILPFSVIGVSNAETNGGKSAPADAACCRAAMLHPAHGKAQSMLC
jgi:hypothetical protein